MESSRQDHRLSHITTLWTLVQQAHDVPGQAACDAQRVLMQRYSGSVYRYLLGALRDPHAADELFQEFSLRFIRGDFRRADPERGRFRDFVRTSLFHLIVDYQKHRKKQPQSLSPDVHAPVVLPPETAESDQQFLQSWREELLDRTWIALAQMQQDSNQPYYTVLRFRAEHPALSSQQMAQELSVVLGKPVNADAVRQILHRARARFADLLLSEVMHSLQNGTEEELTQELIDVGLLSYCRSALERRAKK